MKYFLAIVLSMVALIATAQTPAYIVQHNGIQQFSANCLEHAANSPIYNFLDSCGVIPPPPAGRQTVGHVAYQSGGVAVRDLTEFQSVFGHATAYDAVIAWPGRRNSQPTIVDFLRGSYVAFHVHTNALGQIPSFGFLIHTEYNYGFDPAWSWSRAPGDFSSSLGPNCYVALAQSGQTVGNYATPLGGYAASCHLPPNSDVFLNIKMSDPNQVTGTCPAGARSCPLGLSNNYN